MDLITLFRKINPYVRPYRKLVIVTLILTLVGSFIAQINAVVLDRTVDASARSLNIDKLARTLDSDGDGTLFD